MGASVVLPVLALLLLPGCLQGFERFIGTERACDPLRAAPSHSLGVAGPDEADPRSLAESLASALGDELLDAPQKERSHYVEYATTKGRVIVGEPGGTNQVLDYEGDNPWPGPDEASAKANVSELVRDMGIPSTGSYKWNWEEDSPATGVTAGFFPPQKFSYQSTGIWIRRWTADGDVRIILGRFFEFPPLPGQSTLDAARETAIRFTTCVAAHELKQKPPTPLRLERDQYGGLLLVADGTPLRFTLAYRFSVTFAEKPCGEPSGRHYIPSCDDWFTHDVAVDAVTGQVVKDWHSAGRSSLFHYSN